MYIHCSYSYKLPGERTVTMADLGVPVEDSRREVVKLEGPKIGARRTECRAVFLGVTVSYGST